MAENQITTKDLEDIVGEIFNEAKQEEVNDVKGGTVKDTFYSFLGMKKKDKEENEEEQKLKEKKEQVMHTMEKKKKFEELLKTKFGDALEVLDTNNGNERKIEDEENIGEKNKYSFVLVKKGEPYLNYINNNERTKYPLTWPYKFRYFFGDLTSIYNNDKRGGNDPQYMIKFISPTDDIVMHRELDFIKSYYTVYRIDKTHSDAKAAVYGQAVDGQAVDGQAVDGQAVDENQEGGKRKKTRNNKKKSSKKSKKSKKKNTKKNKTKKKGKK